MRKVYTLSNPFIVCKAMDMATKRITILEEGLNSHSGGVVHICFYNIGSKMMSMLYLLTEFNFHQLNYTLF